MPTSQRVHVSPWGVPGSYDPELGLTLGAAVPCYRIYGNNAIRNAYPGLIDCASLIGGTQIQGRASLGGNLCNSTPSADSIIGISRTPAGAPPPASSA